MKTSEIRIRDPFILPFEEKYYLFSSSVLPDGRCGFCCYISVDLDEWSEPVTVFEPPEKFWANSDFWAPEVHYYKGRFYLFVSLKAEGHMRAVQIMASDKPEGPYTVWSCPITPNDWMSLDGTLYVEDNIPYMVFCHEWVQIRDGEMCAIRLTDDLKAPVGQPTVLFKASEAPWASTAVNNGYITDGPFLHKCSDGRLIMIWSSFDKNGYVEAVAVSDNGRLDGNWKICENTLSNIDGGHGMLFNSFDNKLMFTMHYPNTADERAQFYEIEELKVEPYLKITKK